MEKERPPTDPPSDDEGGDEEADEPDNPFAGIPILGDLGAMFSGPGAAGGNPQNLADTWSNAEQIAKQTATEGKSEKNIDPLLRAALEPLIRVAELHVANVTGLDPSPDGSPVKFELVTRSQWASEALERCRPLMERITKQLGAGGPGDSAASSDDANSDAGFASGAPDWLADQGSSLLGHLARFMSPVMVGVCAGSMVGNLAKTAFGDLDLKLPPEPGTSSTGTSSTGASGPTVIKLIGARLDEFGRQWKLDVSGLLLWACIHQLTWHTVLSVPHVRAAINELLESYVAGFRLDPEATQRQMQEMMEDGFNPDALNADDFGAMQNQFQIIFGQPEILLGTGRTEEQDAIAEELDNRLMLLDAYVHHVTNLAGHRLITDYESLSKAQNKFEDFDGVTAKFTRLLLGFTIGLENPRAEKTEAERAFIEMAARSILFMDGIQERAGEQALEQLFTHAENWPTRSEVKAPGVWLARLGIEWDMEAWEDQLQSEEDAGNF